MSATRRVQQWATFGRMWYLYDAKWQNPFESAKLITNVLSGKNKPIFHELNDCGDHVVVINSAHIALPGDEWERRVYFHHTGRAKGGSWTLAHQVHDTDPTLIFQRACYSTLKGNLLRRPRMARLHVYPEEEIPSPIIENINAQLRQQFPVPTRLDHIDEQKLNSFPKIFDWPKEYILENN